MRPLDPLVADLLRCQHGVATRAQLRHAGLSEDQLRAELEARRWRSLNDRVVCSHNGPLTRVQMFWAAVLSTASPVGLCGLSVLELYGVRGFPSPTIHLIVTKSARVLTLPGVDLAVHESRRFSAEDLWSTRGMPHTSLARAFVDAAVWSPHAETAWRLLAAAVQQSRIRPELLRQQLAEAGRVRHRRTLALLIDDFTGGAQALSEVEFLAFCRRHGFPRPKLQSRLDGTGRRRYLDAEFRSRSGRVFGVEVDGGVHLNVAVRSRDTIKDNDAHLRGRLVLRYASFAIYTDHPEAVRQIREALNLSDAGGVISPPPPDTTREK